MPDILGNCSCRAVQYKISGDIKNIVNCHCSICRKLMGSAFATYVVVPENQHVITQGQEYIATYHLPETTAQKHFCKKCGSPLFNTNPGRYGSVKIVSFGTLEEGNGLSPLVNIYCENKVDWLEKLFDIKNMSEGVKG